MKNFDLEAAKRGAAVCTRSEKPVEIITTNGRSGKFPILAYIGSSARVMSFSANGQYRHKYESAEDLVMRDDDYLEKMERGEYESPSWRRDGNPVIKQNLTTDREYWRRVYAGQAMQGIFAGRNWRNGEMIPDCIGFARNAVELADALIEELDKTEQK